MTELLITCPKTTDRDSFKFLVVYQICYIFVNVMRFIKTSVNKPIKSIFTFVWLSFRNFQVTAVLCGVILHCLNMPQCLMLIYCCVLYVIDPSLATCSVL